jgi:hypothetical protein
MAAYKSFEMQQGTSGRFPPIPVFIQLSAFRRSESPSLEPTSPLVPCVSLHYAQESGEKGEFASISVNVRQWHSSGNIMFPPTPKSFYANPDPSVRAFVDQLEKQGGIKKVEGAETHRHGDDVLELFEIVEEKIEVVKVADTKPGAAPAQCAMCKKKEGGNVTLNLCGGCKKIR